MAANLDPQTLQQILAMLNTQQRVGNPTPGGMSYWSDPSQTYDPTTDTHGYMLGREYGWDRQGVGDGSSEVLNGRDQDYIMQLIAGTDGGLGDRWDTQGNYLDQYEAQDGGGRQMNQAALMMAGGYLGGSYLSGTGPFAGATGMTASQQAAMMAANGMTDAEIAAALGTAGAESAGLAGVGGAAAGGGGAVAGGGAGSTGIGSQLVSGVKTGVDALGGGKGVATLLGGVAGALDSGDKEQTSSRDPWSAAQPYLKGLLAEGGDIYNQRKAEPFNKEMQAGYANLGGLLDLVNNNAGGLLAGPQANASGANQFSRSNPRRGLLGTSFNPTAEQWAPVGYGDFGMTRYRGGK